MFKNLLSSLSKYLIPTVFILGVVVRLYGVYHIAPQYYDIGTYGAWGNIMIDKGPKDFFSSTWSDYLPLPIYFCAMIQKVSTTFHLDFSIVFKLFTSLIEIGLISLVYIYFKSKRTLLLSALLLMSPALIGDTSFWGQLDSIPSLLALLSLALLFSSINQNRKTIYASIIFGLAVAFKPIMLITLPVILITLFKQRFSWKNILSFAVISFVVFLLPAIPVAGVAGSFKFLLDKSMEQASTYPYTTINGWNLWSVVPLHNTWPPDSTTILGISPHNLGLLLFFAFAFLQFRSWHKHGWDPKYVYKIAGTLLVVFYTFTTRMHERHLLFGLPFLALAAVSESWILIPLLLLTLTFTLNLWGAYYWVNHSSTWPLSASWIMFVSWINVLSALMLVFVDNLAQASRNILVIFSSNKKLIAILVLASLLRLVHLSYPSDYIFDEVYHSFTAREYLHNHVEAWEWWTTPPAGVAYEWTHPPVAKYGMVLGMIFFGENSFGWRVGSAVMGVISILGIYQLVLSLSGKKTVALIAALLVSIEGLHISQSRVGMNDMYMLCFLIWSLFQASKSRFKLAALLFGLALGSKWSAVYGVVPLFALYTRDIKPKFDLKSITLYVLGGIRLVLISLVVYVLTFVPFLVAGHTWAQWWELQRQMWYYHTHLVATHAYQSVPWQWVLSLRPVWYYVHYGFKVSNIYAQGNPLLLWFGLAAIIVLIPKLLKFPYFIYMLLYSIFTLPWVASPRIMFFYHYLPSATFLCIVLADWLHELPKSVRTLLIISFCIALVILAPVYYGIPMSSTYWNVLFKIFPSWK